MLYRIHFRTSKFKFSFSHGELILLKKSWKSFTLMHFRTSIFKNFSTMLKLISLKKSLNSFILVHVRTSKFKISFNHGELFLFYFRRSKFKIWARSKKIEKRVLAMIFVTLSVRSQICVIWSLDSLCAYKEFNNTYNCVHTKVFKTLKIRKRFELISCVCCCFWAC